MVATPSRWPGIAAAEQAGLEELHEAADGVDGYSRGRFDIPADCKDWYDRDERDHLKANRTSSR
jgi:hypothetical protein